MIPKKYFPSLTAGFGAAVLSIIPGLKSLTCCLIVPAAAYLSLYLFNKTMNGKLPIKLNRALSFGLITGLIAALFVTIFDLIITYLTHTNDLVNGLPQFKELLGQYELGSIMDESLKLMGNMVAEIKKTGFSALYTVMVTASNFFVLSLFGMLGGLVGMAMLNKKNKRQF